MIKKLFLTSMLAVMVVCPALAATVVPDENGSGFIDPNSTAENCYGEALTYQGTEETSGTVKYEAIWNADQCSITLNSDVVSESNPNGRGGTSSNPATLKTLYNSGAYLSQSDLNSALGLAAGVTNTYVMTSDQKPLINTPTGKQVTLTTHVSYPSHAVYGSTMSTGGVEPVNLVFTGFYSQASSGGVQYIDANGYITADTGTSPNVVSGGASVASGLYKSVATVDENTGETTYSCPATTWYAQYSCFDTIVQDLPDLDSHTFAGWVDENNDPISNNKICIDKNTIVTATWEAKKFDIVYNPGPNCSGSAYTAIKALEFGKPYSIAALTTTGISAPSGYAFYGWTTDPNATTTGTWATDTAATPATDGCNDAGGCLTGMDNWYRAEGLTLYAVCTGNGVRIIYNCGNPENTTTTLANNVSPQSVTVGAAFVLADSDACSAPGYTFIGWDCPNLGGTYDTPLVAGAANTLYSGGWDSSTYNQTFDYTGGDVTCTAKWRKNTITLQWYLDHELTQPHNGNSSSCQFGTAAGNTGGISLTTPTNPGYTFGGWKVVGWEQ